MMFFILFSLSVGLLLAALMHDSSYHRQLGIFLCLGSLVLAVAAGLSL